jgi:hypothetical protein
VLSRLALPAALAGACAPSAVATDANESVYDGGITAPGDSGAPSDGAPDPATDATDAGPCDGPIGAPPASLGLAPFYAKYLDAAGIPVIASAKTSDAALRQACRIGGKMLAFRADVRASMKANSARIAVMARTEVTTDIPEHADLYTAFPGTDWDTRARGLGATVARPATSCAEENLLCDKADRYAGENILVHELAHGIASLGVAFADLTFESRLNDAFTKAIAAAKWKDTYAATSPDEYFAEGVQSYFGTNREASPPDGIHNHVNTRSELLAYDAALHALIAEAFGPDEWTPICP